MSFLHCRMTLVKFAFLPPFRYVSRTEGNKLGKSHRQYKTKKGDRNLPRINHFCIVMIYKHLTREQRYAIYLGLQEGKSQKAIARQINVHPSTICREIKRNSTRLGRYSWRIAHESACIRKEHLPGNRSMDGYILKKAIHLLRTEDWSPKQISGYLALSSMRISHETIYRRIRADESGELRRHCRAESTSKCNLRN